MTEPTKTTCPYCGVGCGLLVTPSADGSAKVVADPAHPANLGRLCSKGAALGETIGTDGRLLLSAHRRWQRVDWDQALDHVATRFNAIIDAHGPDAVAFYVSGQLLTEDYYVANKLMKGFIGSGQHRYQLPALHGLQRRRLQARLRRRCRALRLRGPGAGGVDRAGRVEHRLVSSGGLPAHQAGQARQPQAPGRRHRSAPHRHLRDSRTCIWPWHRGPTRCCSTACCTG